MSVQSITAISGQTTLINDKTNQAP